MKEIKIYIKNVEKTNSVLNLNRTLFDMPGMYKIHINILSGEVILMSDQDINEEELKKILRDNDFEFLFLESNFNETKRSDV